MLEYDIFKSIVSRRLDLFEFQDEFTVRIMIGYSKNNTIKFDSSSKTLFLFKNNEQIGRSYKIINGKTVKKFLTQSLEFNCAHVVYKENDILVRDDGIFIPFAKRHDFDIDYHLNKLRKIMKYKIVINKLYIDLASLYTVDIPGYFIVLPYILEFNANRLFQK